MFSYVLLILNVVLTIYILSMTFLVFYVQMKLIIKHSGIYVLF